MNRQEFVKKITYAGLISIVPLNSVADTENVLKRLIEGNDNFESTKLLISRLNLNYPGLERVKSAKNNPDHAKRYLLTYYRSRHSVKFFIGRKPDHKVPGVATKKDIKLANDALKHIFLGQPDYPPHFVGKDINWDARPVPDNEWVWQLNRMYFWNDMGKAYWATDEAKYAKAWSRQLIDWVKKNPHDGHHKYAWRSIEAGIRGERWTYLFQRFVEAPSFTPIVLVAMLNSLYNHATYLMSKYTKGSNWGLIESRGLIFIAIFFPEFKDSERWRNTAIERLNMAIHNQVFNDGFQKELSFDYQMVALKSFMTPYKLAKMNGLKSKFPDSYFLRMEKMCAVFMKLVLPNGTTPMFGDSFRGEPGQYQQNFKNWAKIFKRSDFLYLGSNGNKGKIPEKTAYALKECGYYSMRSNWDKNAIFLVLKCGPDGGYHCQPDNGTFVLYAGEQNLMPDSGSYMYSSDPKGRAWFRQTKVHKTLTLNGENSDYAPKLLLWKPGKNLDLLVVENQSYPKLKHRRAVLFVNKTFFVFIDESIGEATGNVDLHFQLAPGKAIYNKKRRAVQSDYDKPWNVFIQSNEQPGLLLEKEKGQVSFVYHEKQPRPAFRYRLHKQDTNGKRFVTTVAPYKGSVPDVDVNILGNPKIGAPHFDLEIVSKKWGIRRRISYKLSSV